MKDNGCYEWDLEWLLECARSIVNLECFAMIRFCLQLYNEI